MFLKSVLQCVYYVDAPSISLTVCRCKQTICNFSMSPSIVTPLSPDLQALRMASASTLVSMGSRSSTWGITSLVMSSKPRRNKPGGKILVAELKTGAV